MSILNLALQCVGLMRNGMSQEFEKKVKAKSGVKNCGSWPKNLTSNKK